MNKEKVVVPKGIRYIGDWEDYNLENYDFPHILNKVLTGCGFTEYCIRNNQPLILTSPRKFLLENKEDQHQGYLEVYYVNNEIETSLDFELDITDDKQRILKKKETSKMSNDEVRTNLETLKEGIRRYVMECDFRKITPKILVTYDSFRHVKEALEEVNGFSRFQVIVDEFQSIFIDSRFKSDTELELLHHLQGVKKLCFVSATPMLDKYLDMLDEFKNLPYYELDWSTEDPGRVKRPRLEVKFTTTKTLNDEIKLVVQNYLKGNFEERLDSKTGTLIQSKECVIFVNSVKGICQAIRSNNLHIDQCNILCARSTDNEKKVRKAFNDVLKKEHEDERKPPKVDKSTDVIGKIPKRGEHHKMFTFCTRTVYLGADFYSTNARSFIFSDSNIDCLSVDISMDLEQILGRQRLTENPWKDSATIVIKTTSDRLKYSKEDFDKRLAEKIRKSNSLLSVYDNTKIESKHDLAEKYEKDAVYSKYIDDYVAVNHHAGKDLLPVFNNLVMVADMRTFDVQQIDYKDRFTVFNTIQGEGIDSINDYVSEFANKFNSIRNVTEKLKLLVEFGELVDVTEKDMNNLFELIPSKYHDYYTLMGPDRIRANSYHESELKQEWIKSHSDNSISDSLMTEIYNTFEIGKRYINKDIKQTLKDLYQKYNYNKSAKASDLENYFGLKDILTSDKRHGFEILWKK